jgi:hypothetical protein
MMQENATKDIHFMETVTIEPAMVSLSEKERKTAALMAIALLSTEEQHKSLQFIIH